MYRHLLNCKTMVIMLLIVVMLVFAISFKPNRYQASSFGKNNAIVIDQYSGEAWVTERYDSIIPNSEKIVYLTPVGYCDYQKDTYTYTPDEKRNNKNTTWIIRLKRMFLGL